MRVSDVDRGWISKYHWLPSGRSRIAVSRVLNRGKGAARIIEEYPDLESDDIQQYLEYGACGGAS